MKMIARARVFSSGSLAAAALAPTFRRELQPIGGPTNSALAELSISPHTVRDHVKAIFTKTGFSSRGELVARVFSDHLLDGFHAAIHG